MIFTPATWQAFTKAEIAAVTPLLTPLGIKLHSEQPHIAGERFLMSGKKVVLVGSDESGATVIIKTSADPTSVQEIQTERATQQTIAAIDFAYQPLLAPRELHYLEVDKRVVLVTEFIDQPTPYLSLSTIQQFDLILGAFTMLEGVHATTKSHQAVVSALGQKNSQTYQAAATAFVAESTAIPTVAPAVLEQALAYLTAHQDTIEQYCGFLTHDDFAPHNFRFKTGAIYLIDQSSLLFGNKHESWARFLNYMALYNPELEAAWATYMHDNRAPEEQHSLQLLRVYKLLELIRYHASASLTDVEAVTELSQTRVVFWTDVLAAVLEQRQIEPAVIAAYTTTRDNLRSPEEIKRQRAIQQLPDQLS